MILHMNRLTLILISLLFCSLVVHGQTFEPIDSIDWSLYNEGAQTGVTFGAAEWTILTPGPDTDGNAVFAVQNGSFLIQDVEGTEGCDCDFDASSNCGRNDNTLDIPILPINGFCQVKVSMTVTPSGVLECGGSALELMPGACPSAIGDAWDGTDAMTIAITTLGGATAGTVICGEQGTGPIEFILDVEINDALTITINAGTQDVDESYSISNIVFEGVRRDLTDLNLKLTTTPKINESNIICRNNGSPIKFQIAASPNNATFQWIGPNGWTSTLASPEIANYDPSFSGTYSVTVIDGNSCPITEEIDVTILASNDANCRPQAIFSNLFGAQCSDFTLPSVDDDGVPGAWSPSDDLNLFADSALTFTFTPDNDSIGEYIQFIDVFDISEANKPAIQPVNLPVFCNASSDPEDLILLFNMNLDYNLTVQGDIALFDKITTGESINNVENEYRTFSFLGVAPGSYDFFVEAIAGCSTAEPFIILLNLTVVGQNPVILNESLCIGDYIDTLGYRIFGDTIITTPGVCDTVVIANITQLQPGVRPPSLPHPTGSQSFECGSVFYFYGNEFQGTSQGVFIGGERDEAPPLGPDFDTIFYTSYQGPFILPYPASNGCDSIISIDLILGNPTFTFDSIPLCPGMDTIVNYRGEDITINEANPLEIRTLNQTGGNCIIHEIRGVFAETQRDTIQMMLCASEEIEIEGELFDINRPSEVLSIPPSDGALCPSLLYVDITFDEPERGTLVTSICTGGIITVGGIDFSQEVTAMDIWLPTPASDGCDSIVTLTLTVQDPVPQLVEETVCSDSIFTFLGKEYDINNSSGLDTIFTIQGCDSIIYDINISFFSDPLLIVKPDTSFCANSSVFYPEYNVTLDASLLSYDTVIITPNGCSQTVLFSGTLIPVFDTMIQATICAGDSYILGSQTLTISGGATEVFTAVSTGCDSTVTVDLTVTQEIVEDLDESICSGSEYILGSQTLTITGSYSEVFIGGAANGCDSTVNLTLNVMEPESFPLPESICSGGTYDFNGRMLTEAGVYRDTLTASNTCDSIVVLTLTVREPITSSFDDSTCEGRSYPWAGEFLTEAGSFPDTLVNLEGCDSIVILNLTITPAPVMEFQVTICEGESFEFDGIERTEADIYESDEVSFEGCDSLLRLTLIVNPIERVTIDTTLFCAGSTVTVGSSIYTATGLYVDTMQAVTGCDSIVSLNLLVPDSIITPIDTFICEGQEFILNTSRLSTTGVYDVPFFAANGCDSIVRVNLDVLQLGVLDTVVVLCSGESLNILDFAIGNSTDREVTETDTFIISGTTLRGCDSTVNLTLTRLAFGPPILEETICFGESFQVGDSSYTESGFYSDTLTSTTFACDSIVRLDLDVIPQLITDISPIICTVATFTVGDSVLSESGFYSITLPSATTGCDSLVNVTLSIGDAFITSLPKKRICSGEEFIVGNSTYNSSGIYSDTIISVSGCDSIINLELVVLEVERLSIDTTICSGEVFSIDGKDFTTSIMDSVVIPSMEGGCDSVIIDLNLIVLEEINTVSNIPLCLGQSVTVGSNTYTTEGTFMDTLFASTGCDSVVRSIITIRDSIVTTISEEICIGGSFTIGTSIYNASGDYSDILMSSTGCDSIVMLSLVVVDQVEDSITVTICAGESYPFGGEDRTTTGSYAINLTTMAGCDSIVTLTLTVASELTIEIENIIGTCEGVDNGTFVIREISGATLPFAISGIPGVSTIDMLPFTVSGLSAQGYSIDIADANGCTASRDVQITEDRDNALSIDVFTIDPTGIYDLSLNYSGTIAEILWDNVPGLSCYDCMDPTANIIENTTFGVTVTDIDGCISTEEVALGTSSIGNIFVPNVFNPESSMGNHRFYIRGEDDSESIYDLRIFDRWGNLVFETMGAIINDPDFGWDGTTNGLRLNSDVYVFAGRVYDANGSEQFVQGDLTMLK